MYAITMKTGDRWEDVMTSIVASEKDPNTMAENELFDLFMAINNDSTLAKDLAENKDHWYSRNTEVADLKYYEPIKITITPVGFRPKEDENLWSYDISELEEVIENLDCDIDYYYYEGRIYERST